MLQPLLDQLKPMMEVFHLLEQFLQFLVQGRVALRLRFSRCRRISATSFISVMLFRRMVYSNARGWLSLLKNSMMISSEKEWVLLDCQIWK